MVVLAPTAKVPLLVRFVVKITPNLMGLAHH
jgi:hypothetical protein